MSGPQWQDLFLCHMKLKLPELNLTDHIIVPFHIISQKSDYNVIYGQDLPQELGINLDIQNNFVGWKENQDIHEFN